MRELTLTNKNIAHEDLIQVRDLLSLNKDDFVWEKEWAPRIVNTSLRQKVLHLNVA